MASVFHDGTCSQSSEVHLVGVLVVVAQADGLVERFIDVVVLPLLRWSLDDGLQTHFVALVLQHLPRDRIRSGGPKIGLRANKDDRCLLTNLPDFDPPSLHVIQALLIVDGDAEHETIGLIVADLSIDTKVRISTIIVYLQHDLLLLELFGPTEHVQHVRLVSLIEDLLLVVHDEAGLTYGAVAYED